MRIVVDVSPLSAPRTGIGNYILGMLGGTAEAAGEEDSVVAFALAGPRGAGRIREVLSGLPVEQRIVVVPPTSQTWRTAWSRLGWPRVERFAGELDVFHFSDWMYPRQRAGLRSTMIHDLAPVRFPDSVAPLTRRMHGRKYRNAARTCDLVFVNSEYTANDAVELLAIPRERIHVAYPGVSQAFTPEGERADFGRPYVLAVATLEPRKNVARLVEAFELVRADHPELDLVVAGAEVTWAPSPLAGTSVRGLGFVPDTELPASLSRRRRVRLSVAVRGLRHPDRRGDGLRDARRRVCASFAGRGLGRRGHPGRSREPGSDRRGHPAGPRRACEPRCQGPRACEALHLAGLRRGSPSRFPNRQLRHFRR